MPRDVELPYAPTTLTFEQLYREEYPNLIAVATVLLGSSRDCEDAVQDTMVRAFLNWPKVSRYERPGGWLHRVLTNVCHGRWRRWRTEQRFLARQRQTEPWTNGPSAEVLGFWAAVRRLPERPRLVFTLFYAADRTTAEVASILSIPEGTVRSDLSRARLALAKELEY